MNYCSITVINFNGSFIITAFCDGNILRGVWIFQYKKTHIPPCVHTHTCTQHDGPVVPCQRGKTSGAEPRTAWDPAKPSWRHKQLKGRERRGGREGSRGRRGARGGMAPSNQPTKQPTLLSQESAESYMCDREREEGDLEGDGMNVCIHAYRMCSMRGMYMCNI